MNFAFLILHYNEIELTEAAIESIKTLSGIEEDTSVIAGDECHVDIIVVDNGSPNKTGEVLAAKYEGDKQVKVLLEVENGGFAKGNNAGFRYIKSLSEADDKEIPDFLIALNNDITFPQKDFLKKLTEVYEASSPRFYVAGPDVYTPHIRSHISPLYPTVRKKEEAFDAIIVLEKINEAFQKGISVANYTRFLQEKYQSSGLLKLYNKLRKSEYDAGALHDKPLYDCVLNGACLIFDKRYIEENDFLFEEKTFLYVEEDFLTKRLTDQGKAIRYCPELVVSHVGQGSSGFNRMSYKEYVKKNIATNRRVIESWKTYIESL